MSTCQYYVSIDQPECGEPACPVHIHWPSTNSNQTIDLCVDHMRTVSAIQREQAARKRIEGKRMAQKKRESK